MVDGEKTKSLKMSSPCWGRYVLVEEVGSGGMGRVYRARDQELDRDVALKVLHARVSDAKTRARFEREAKALARLAHPNVIKIHDIGSFEGRGFIAMQLVEGSTLERFVVERSPRWPEVLDCFVKCAAALAAAHAVGIVHRDFKPGNVLVDGRGGVLVSDFGLARLADEIDSDDGDTPSVESSLSGLAALTQTGAAVGTPAYMAPEVHLGRAADPASDQFSFCVALFASLYGVLPFAATELSDLIAAKVQGDIVAVRRGVPRGLRALTLRGLRCEPGRRHASMADLLRALARFRGRRRSRLAVVGAVGAAVVAAGWAIQARPAGTCPDPTPRALTAEAFGPPVRDHLSEYAARLDRARVRVCEATERYGEQSDTLRDVRDRCLDRRRRELEVVGELLHADAPGGVAAARAIFALEPPEVCESLPHRAAVPGAGPSVDALARAVTWRELGDTTRAQEQLRVLVDLPVGLQAEAALLRAQLATVRRDAATARASFLEAAALAEAAQLDRVAARAWVGHWALAAEAVDVGWGSDVVGDLAKAAVTRAGDDSLGAELELARAQVDAARGNVAGAVARLRSSAAGTKNLVLRLDMYRLAGRLLRTVGEDESAANVAVDARAIEARLRG